VRRKAAREVIDILHEIATLLVHGPLVPQLDGASNKQHQNTHLDRQQLSYCVSLIENGASPEALAVRSLHVLEAQSVVWPCRCHGEV
jgi:mitotic-spindle organizing protein 1